LGYMLWRFGIVENFKWMSMYEQLSTMSMLGPTSMVCRWCCVFEGASWGIGRGKSSDKLSWSSKPAWSVWALWSIQFGVTMMPRSSKPAMHWFCFCVLFR
jgi:hypothetical protein